MTTRQEFTAMDVTNTRLTDTPRIPQPGGPQCEADGVRNGPDGPGGTEHYWTCTAPGAVDVDGALMCEDHAGERGYGPKQEEYGYAPDDGHLIMIQLGLIADAAIQMLEHVSMDAGEDGELHARAVGALRGRLDELAAATKKAATRQESPQ